MSLFLADARLTDRSLSGGVLHAALCEGRLLHPHPPGGTIVGKNIRIVHNASDDVGADICFNFSLPPVRPQWGLQGTISSSPAPPSEWLEMQSIYARVPKPGSAQSTPDCVSMEKRVQDKDVSLYSNLHVGLT